MSEKVVSSNSEVLERLTVFFNSECYSSKAELIVSFIQQCLSATPITDLDVQLLETRHSKSSSYRYQMPKIDINLPLLRAFNSPFPSHHWHNHDRFFAAYNKDIPDLLNSLGMLLQGQNPLQMIAVQNPQLR